MVATKQLNLLPLIINMRYMLILFSFFGMAPLFYNAYCGPLPNEAADPLQLLEGKADPGIRHVAAERLWEKCIRYTESGNKVPVANILDRLIQLLDDKDEYVVSVVASCIATLGVDGKKALPKLLEINASRHQEDFESWSAVPDAIARISSLSRK